MVEPRKKIYVESIEVFMKYRLPLSCLFLVDGKYIVTKPMDLLKASSSLGIDMMYGCTGNEVIGFLSSDPFGMNPENTPDKYLSSTEVILSSRTLIFPA